MNQEFRMHCGLTDGHAGLLRVLSTAERPSLDRMDTYMQALEKSVKRMRELLDEAIAERLSRQQV